MIFSIFPSQYVNTTKKFDRVHQRKLNRSALNNTDMEENFFMVVSLKFLTKTIAHLWSDYIIIYQNSH